MKKSVQNFFEKHIYLRRIVLILYTLCIVPFEIGIKFIINIKIHFPIYIFKQGIVEFVKIWECK